MLEKFEILIVIFFLLLTFYLVIFLGARKKGESLQSAKIKTTLSHTNLVNYLIGNLTKKNSTN